MVCQYLEELFELYLLGVAGAEDAISVSEHLRSGCATCFGQMREASLTIYLLSHSTKPKRLDPKSRTSLLRRIQKEKGVHPDQ